MASLLHQQEGLEKQALMQFLGTAGRGLAAAGTKVAVKPWGRIIKSLAKRTKGFQGTFDPKTGKLLTNSVGKEGFANRMWHIGQKVENWHNKMDAGFKAGIKGLQEAGHTGLATAAKWTAPATGAYMLGAPIAASLTGDPEALWAKPAEWVWNLNPVTMSMSAAMNGGMGLYAKAQDAAANKAYEASMLTAHGIAQNLANRGRLEHLYGAWNPTGYAQKLFENSVGEINKNFAERMRQEGLDNWRPKTVLGNYNPQA